MYKTESTHPKFKHIVTQKKTSDIQNDQLIQHLSRINDTNNLSRCDAHKTSKYEMKQRKLHNLRDWNVKNMELDLESYVPICPIDESARGGWREMRGICCNQLKENRDLMAVML